MKIHDELPTSRSRARHGEHRPMYEAALDVAKRNPGKAVELDGVHPSKVYGAGLTYARRAPFKTPDGEAKIHFRNTKVNPETGVREGMILVTWNPIKAK